MTTRKKLIEVALPLDAINHASAREKSIRHGHPSTLHLWWARRPLAAARAVIFAQMLDDPSANPDLFPTEEAQEQERQRLFRIIEALVRWENTTNETVLEAARDEIWASWRRACADQRSAIRTQDIGEAERERILALFDPDRLPAFHDPFAGGGALPLEAQRLGLEAYASDLNPVAVLINKAMIEIPPRFAGLPPVNPVSRAQDLGLRGSHALSRADGLAEGDGSDQGGVSAGEAASEGGSVWDARSDHPRGDLDSREHRRGMGKGVSEGTGAVPGDCSGLAGRDGDASDPVRGTGLVSLGEDDGAAKSARGSRQDAEHSPSQAARSPLSPNPLSPKSYPLFARSYKGAQGLAEDVRHYGQWMRDEAERRIGHLYPKVEVTAEMARERPDLKPYVGRKLTVIAWLWARTVKSPNPAFADVEVPLASTFMLSTKAGREAYVEVVRTQDLGLSDQDPEPRKDTASPDSKSYVLPSTRSPYRFTVKVGKPKDAGAAKSGTKLSRGANFRCLMSGTPIAGDYIKTEGKAGRMGARLMAIVAEGDRGRVYLAPTPVHEAAALEAKPEWRPETPLAPDPRALWTPPYGLTTFGDLYTPRQLVALTTFSDLVGEAMQQVKRDALAAGLPDDRKPLRDGGTGATAYAEAVGVYLGIALSRLTDICNALCRWEVTKTQVRNLFGRQAIPMLWDYAENNVFGEAAGDYMVSLGNMVKALEQVPSSKAGFARHDDAQTQSVSAEKIVSTDPPYYDNIGYADLSDFFYAWLRRSLQPVFPDLFATVAVPKAEELVATPYRHGSKEKAEAFFLDGMTQAMHRLAVQAHPAFPVTIYYAFKQSETESAEGTASTGWETFLDAVIRAGFGISGTWPMRTELGNRMIGSGTNALASSIVLVCRPRPASAPTATRREFVAALKRELPLALTHLQRGNIAPVDLAQAAIGPGMAVYTRYSKVLDAQGQPLTVREALALINQTLDEALAEQEGDFDADTRWAVTWFEQQGFAEGEYGVAEQLSKAKNTSVAGMVEAGIVESKRGKVHLLRPDELPADWDPATDPRLTAWETVHHLIRALESGGESAAAALVAKLGARAEIARELAYRLYVVSERKKRAAEALAYNGLVQSWPEIARLAQAAQAATVAQSELEI
jgi:putative DNA methylase